MFFWDRHKAVIGCYEALTRSACEKYRLTQMEYDIIMFLHNSPEYTTAADIVRIRKSTKSHVSTSLKSLENKGLIERIQAPDNKKRIDIVLLSKADPIIEEGIKAQKEFRQIALTGLTQEEKRVFKTVFEKICGNADNYLKNYANRDDEK